MEKTIKIMLSESVAGRGFAYGKGENDVPETIARDLIAAGLARLVGAKPSDQAEKPVSPAKKAEKR